MFPSLPFTNSNGNGRINYMNSGVSSNLSKPWRKKTGKLKRDRRLSKKKGGTDCLPSKAVPRLFSREEKKRFALFMTVLCPKVRRKQTGPVRRFIRITVTAVPISAWTAIKATNISDPLPPISNTEIFSSSGVIPKEVQVSAASSMRTGI